MQTEKQLKERLTAYRRMISNGDNLPVYKLLQQVIEIGIAEGEWTPGQAIPPERVLATLMGVSVGTVKKAILNLVDQGKLYRRQGSGTYVSAPSFIRHLRRYYLFLKDFKDEESPNTITLHSIRFIPPSTEINPLINANPEEGLLEIVRLFHEADDVVVISKSYFKANDFAGLDQVLRERFEQVPLFVILEEDYNQRTAYSNELIGVHVPDPEEAQLLGGSVGAGILRIRTVNFTDTNQPYEYRESLCRTGDKFIYRHVTY